MATIDDTTGFDPSEGENGGQRTFLPAPVEIKTWEATSLPASGTSTPSLGEFHN